jgi:hypothetical protein
MVGISPNAVQNKPATHAFYVGSRLRVKHNLWKTSATASKAEGIEPNDGHFGTGRKRRGVRRTQHERIGQG